MSDKPSARLDGKRTIVTGAASGIGRASAHIFAAEGARVLATDVAAAGLDETVEQVRAAGGSADALVLDVGEEEQIAAAVERVQRDWGGLDAFFANAGVSGSPLPPAEVGVDEWTHVLRINLIGVAMCVKHAAAAMIAGGGGSIICTASVAGLRSGAGPSPYSASKAGVISLVQTSANQLSGTDVRINAICPGLIETGMTQIVFDAARAAGKADRIGQLNPLRRAGHPEEIARVAAFLASDAASYINGQALAVDGGLSSSHPVVPGRAW